MGRVVTAARVLQMLPVPSLLHGGVLRTHLGGLCLRRGGRGTGGGQRPWSLGTLEPTPPWACSLGGGSACLLERLMTGAVGPLGSVPCSKWSGPIRWISALERLADYWYLQPRLVRSVLPITGRRRHGGGAGRGACDRKPLAAVPGGSWLPLEGLHFLPTPLEVQISFGDNWGVICSTSSKLLNQMLIWPQTPMNCPCRFAEAGAQTGQSPFWDPGRQTGFLGVSRGAEHAEGA